MRSVHDFAYGQARLQARHGARPQEADWRALDGARTLAAHLERARAVMPRDWTDGLDAGLSSHAVEAALRRVAARGVDEVAHWVPEPWRPSLRGMGLLPALPWVAAALRDEPLPAWADAEPWAAPLVGLDPAARRAVLATTAAAPLLAAGAGGEDVGRAWAAAWRRSWPAGADADAALIDLADLVVRLFATPTRGDRTRDLGARRPLLERRLLRHFRRGAGSVAAAIAHLALTLLDLERFRGITVRRCLFSGADAEVAV